MVTTSFPLKVQVVHCLKRSLQQIPRRICIHDAIDIVAELTWFSGERAGVLCMDTLCGEWQAHRVKSMFTEHTFRTCQLR